MTAAAGCRSTGRDRLWCSRRPSLLQFTRTARPGFLALGTTFEHFAKIDRPRVLHDALEAQRHLGIAHLRVGPELTLDLVPNGPPRARQMTRDGRLVLLEQPADLGERQLLRIVAAEPQPVSRGKPRHREPERLLHARDITGSIGMGSRRRRC